MNRNMAHINNQENTRIIQNLDSLSTLAKQASSYYLQSHEKNLENRNEFEIDEKNVIHPSNNNSNIDDYDKDECNILITSANSSNTRNISSQNTEKYNQQPNYYKRSKVYAMNSTYLQNMLKEGQFRLKFMNLPLYPIIHHEYSVQVALVSGEHTVHGITLKLKPSLVYEYDLDTPLGENIVVIESNKVTLNKSGQATVRFTMKELSSLNENKKCVLKVEVIDGSDSQFASNLKPLLSSPMTCVLHRLSTKILSNDPTGNYDVSESIWYKDESGKDKYIEMLIELLDGNNQRVLTRHVPLKPILTYSGSGDLVLRQDILQILPESKLTISENGATVVKFRLNDVSKNHQRQLFSILWTANISTQPNLIDISPDFSIPIEVRSKRTKRIHPDKDSNDDLSQTNRVKSSRLGSASSNFNTNNSNNKIHYTGINGNSNTNTNISNIIIPKMSNNNNNNIRNGIELNNTSHDTTVLASVQSYMSDMLHNNSRDSTHLPTTSIDISAIVSHNSISNNNINNNSLSHSISTNNLSNSIINLSSNISNSSNGHSSLQNNMINTISNESIPPTGRNIDQAIGNILSWTSQVISGLQEIKWHQIGIDTSNNSHPLYDITNPNEKIDSILREYSDTISNSFVVLLDDYRNRRSISYNSMSHSNDNHSIQPQAAITIVPSNSDNSMTKSNIHRIESDSIVSGYYRSLSASHDIPMISNSHNHSSSRSRNHHNYSNKLHSDNIMDLSNHNSNSNNALNTSNMSNPYDNNNNNSNNPNHSFRSSQQGMNNDHEGDWGTLLDSMENSAHSRQITPEDQVYYVVASPVQQKSYYDRGSSSSSSSSSLSSLGSETIGSIPFQSIIGTFCSFDMNKKLVGFYREMQDQYNITIIKFLPLFTNDQSNPPPSSLSSSSNNLFNESVHLNNDEIFMLENDFNHKTLNDSNDIYSLGKCQNDLEKMKQEVMVHFWLSEVSLLDGI